MNKKNRSNAAATRARRDRFTSTRWSLVLAAGARPGRESREALASLCQIYWYPLYAYVRRHGYDFELAEDLVQAFFLTLIEKNTLRQAQPDRGRFRSFLLAAFRHFLLHEADRARAQKRGGGRAPEPLDFSGAEGRYALEPRDDETPETLFERRWSQIVLERAERRLRASFMRAGRGRVFERLKGSLLAGPDVPYRELAASLGMSEGAVKVAVHRLRRQFVARLREEIADTLADERDIDDELRFLFAALGPRGRHPPF